MVAEFKSSPAAVAGSHHFIGITADAAGFMAHPDNWRPFDLVIAKPIDLTNLGTVLENFERYMAWSGHAAVDQGAADRRPSFWRMMALKQTPARLVCLPIGGGPIGERRSVVAPRRSSSQTAKCIPAASSIFP